MFDTDDQEILDVVNKNDEVIGTIERSDIMSLRDTPGRYLRGVDIFIQRSNGDIYLPRRSKLKKIFPGGLDISVAGHISAGESYENAAIREVKEEAGFDITIDQLEFITDASPSPALFYIRKLYILHTDQIPALSNEHEEAVWVAPNKLKDFVNNDVPTKEALTEDIPILLDYLNAKKV